MRIRSFTLWTLLLTGASLVPSTALGRPIDLDRYPVCEASAAMLNQIAERVHPITRK